MGVGGHVWSWMGVGGLADGCAWVVRGCAVGGRGWVVGWSCGGVWVGRGWALVGVGGHGRSWGWALVGVDGRAELAYNPVQTAAHDIYKKTRFAMVSRR